MDQPVPAPPAPEVVPAPRPGRSPFADTVTVILVAPELFDGNVEAITQALRRAPEGARVLVRIGRKEDLALVESSATLGLPSQWLLGPDVPAPALRVHFARMPEGSDSKATDEMALALSDVLIVPPARNGDGAGLVALASSREWRRRTVAPGEAIAPVSPLSDTSHALGSNRCRNRLLWEVASRLDPIFLECFAIRLRGEFWTSFAETRKNLRKCFRPRGHPAAYFAPGDWVDLAPDRAAAEPNTPIVAAFDEFDRRALFGAALHRDAIWFVHLSSALAVVIAVLGAILLSPSSPSGEHPESEAAFSILPIAELLLLGLVVACIWRLRRIGLQQTWQTCRFAAEHLRVARMCLPLMALPAAMCRPDSQTSDPEVPDEPPAAVSKEGVAALEAVEVLKRVVRDQGLPRHPTEDLRSADLLWLRLIVADQEKYHRGNAAKLERAESGMVKLATLFFILAMCAVVSHIGLHDHATPDRIGWLSVVLAAVPALAAVYYGVRTRAPVEYRTVLCVAVFLILVPLLSVPLYVTFRHFAEGAAWSLVFTAGGPALAAALHGIATRLGIVHRAALSKDAADLLGRIKDEIDALEKASKPSDEYWPELHRLAMKAADAMSSENASWHTLVQRQRDDIPA